MEFTLLKISLTLDKGRRNRKTSVVSTWQKQNTIGGHVARSWNTDTVQNPTAIKASVKILLSFYFPSHLLNPNSFKNNAEIKESFIGCSKKHQIHQEKETLHQCF